MRVLLLLLLLSLLLGDRTLVPDRPLNGLLPPRGKVPRDPRLWGHTLALPVRVLILRRGRRRVRGRRRDIRTEAVLVLHRLLLLLHLLAHVHLLLLLLWRLLLLISDLLHPRGRAGLGVGRGRELAVDVVLGDPLAVVALGRGVHRVGIIVHGGGCKHGGWGGLVLGGVSREAWGEGVCLLGLQEGR